MLPPRRPYFPFTFAGHDQREGPPYQISTLQLDEMLPLRSHPILAVIGNISHTQATLCTQPMCCPGAPPWAPHLFCHSTTPPHQTKFHIGAVQGQKRAGGLTASHLCKSRVALLLGPPTPPAWWHSTLFRMVGPPPPRPISVVTFVKW